MRVLITGANGFVGRWTAQAFLHAGHDVVGAVRSVDQLPPSPQLHDVHWIPLELGWPDSVARALECVPDVVVHLAAVASGAEARRDPLHAWTVNTLGTCELLYTMERLGSRARFVYASTGEVYGRGHAAPIPESAPTRVTSPYAASKLAAEEAVLEVHRRTGLPVVIARCFAQTGPGQRDAFVVPALARRLIACREAGAREITVGNLAPVREFVDVRDVAAALVLLAAAGEAGGVYNVARGEATSLRGLLDTLAGVVGCTADPVPDPSLFRAADLDYLVGDGRRLAALGWSPRYDLARSLADLVSSLERSHPES